MKPMSNQNGWQIHSHELRPLLGLKAGCHLPANGQEPLDVNGTPVYILPANANGRRTHRVMAICSCGKHIPAGRFHQHLKGHKS